MPPHVPQGMAQQEVWVGGLAGQSRDSAPSHCSSAPWLHIQDGSRESHPEKQRVQAVPFALQGTFPQSPGCLPALTGRE